jgi:hypothetical protein
MAILPGKPVRHCEDALVFDIGECHSRDMQAGIIFYIDVPFWKIILEEC